LAAFNQRLRRWREAGPLVVRIVNSPKKLNNS
jgi:hypothetical protein